LSRSANLQVKRFMPRTSASWGSSSGQVRCAGLCARSAGSRSLRSQLTRQRGACRRCPSVRYRGGHRHPDTPRPQLLLPRSCTVAPRDHGLGGLRLRASRFRALL